MLRNFFRDHHPEFPILPDPVTFARGYDSSVLLFWTMIAIASKHKELHNHLHHLLEPHVHQMAVQPALAIEHPLGTVQALLLLCFFPFNFQATNSDPSWHYAGAALHSALRYGIHRPKHFCDFVYNGKLDEAGTQAFRRAWVGCFVVNQMASSDLGTPSTAHPDSTIMEVIRSPRSQLPDVLNHYLRIAYESHSICQTLGNNGSTTHGLLENPVPMTRAFASTVHELGSELLLTLTQSTEIALLGVGLQLYAFALLGGERHQSHSQPQDPRASEYLVKAGGLAARIIETACRDTSRSSWPAMTRMSVVFATQFLIKLSAISGHVDRSMAQNSVSQAWALLKSRLEVEHDHLARICAIIAYLSRTESEKESSSAVSVKARMASNLAVDAIWGARSRFSRNVHEVRPSDYTATAAMEELIQNMSNGVMESYFFDASLNAGDMGMWSSGLQYPLPATAAGSSAFPGQLPT